MISNLFVVTISAGVHQDLVLLVLLRVEHVVAFLKKAQITLMKLNGEVLSKNIVWYLNGW